MKYKYDPRAGALNEATAPMAARQAAPQGTMTRSASASQTLVPLQDVLGLGSAARMNRPGIASGNWRWRATARSDAG